MRGSKSGAGWLLVGLIALAACGGSAGQTAPPAPGTCAGGSQDGMPCMDISGCAGGGVCFATAFQCAGGSQNGMACTAVTGCAGGGVCQASAALQKDEVRAIMELAARSLDREMVVAVTDRRGVVLGVGANFALDFAVCNQPLACPAVETGCPATPTPVDDCRAVDLALQLARTASFFSANQTPLTSRSIRFISGEHFPPGIANAAAAALFGIENTNRGCSFDDAANPIERFIPRARSLAAVLRDRGRLPGPALRCATGTGPDDLQARCGCTTGIATLPGAVPIYRNGVMAGGIGVVLRGVAVQCDPVAAFDSTSVLRLADGNPEFDLMEFAARAYAGDNTGFPNVTPEGLRPVCQSDLVVKPLCCNDTPPCDFNILPARQLPFDPVIFIDGIEVPEINLSPPVPPGAGTFTGITDFIFDPADLQDGFPFDSAQPLPIGWLLGPNPSTPGAEPLSAADVQAIIENAYDLASRVRAAIRLPLQARTQMMLAVSDTNDALLGLFRMNDATVFSIDVAVAKSRNVAWFSSLGIDPLDTMDCPGPTPAGCIGQAFPPGTAITNRTISFSAQPFFPSGINRTSPGPFRRAFVYDSANPCTNGQEPANGRQNGIVFFPGSAPTYRGALLVGGFGVSGDGVEQDDLVSFGGVSGAPNFEPPPARRADQLFVRDVRLPYLKFNRRPYE